MTTYIARVEAHQICVYRVDRDHHRLVDTIRLPSEPDLRGVLLDAGWRPTGRKARGAWGLIYLEPLKPTP